jgi:hypothetical protein
MNVDLDLVKSVHYTVCRKPWNCVTEGYLNGQNPKNGEKGVAIDTRTGNLEQCLKVVKRWHEFRSDFETKLHAITQDDGILACTNGEYKRDILKGHCKGEGGNNYIQILQGSEKLFERVAQMYI